MRSLPKHVHSLHFHFTHCLTYHKQPTSSSVRNKYLLLSHRFTHRRSLLTNAHSSPNMAVDGPTANVKQLATMQHKKNIRISRIPFASQNQKDQSEDHEEAPHLPQHHREISTRTAYVQDTNVMVKLPIHNQKNKKQLSNKYLASRK